MKNKRYVLTYFEKILINMLPENWKYIARDRNGKLYLYSEEPKKSEDGYWCVANNNQQKVSLSVGFEILNFINFEDTKPIVINDLKK